MRIYCTSKPDVAPTETRVSANKLEEAITKLSWLDNNIIYLGKRNGSVEIWDDRIDSASGPAATSVIEVGAPIQDLEINTAHNLALVAVNQKISFLSLSDLRVMHEFSMPKPMHFREEGGASLRPDGRRFLAVRLSLLTYIYVFLFYTYFILHLLFL